MHTEDWKVQCIPRELLLAVTVSMLVKGVSTSSKITEHRAGPGSGLPLLIRLIYLRCASNAEQTADSGMLA